MPREVACHGKWLSEEESWRSAREESAEGRGGTRGVPQALLQVLQPAWDETFAEGSDGFRPGRSAPRAIARARAYLEEGSGWVVDVDLEKCLDRVNHDQLLSLVNGRVKERRGLQRIERYLQAGARTGDGFEVPTEGTPQGDPLWPRCAHLRLDGFEKELERRGHRFGRAADERTLYV